MPRIKNLYKCFEYFQAHGNIALFSDPHFGDEDRPLMNYNIEEKEQCDILLENINHGDTIICLGDLGKDWKKWFGYLRANRRRNKFILIAGNHDDTKKDEMIDFFDEVYFGPLMISPKIMLSHEPILNSCWCNFHGHCHGGEFFDWEDKVAIGINLAANVCDFKAFQLNTYVNNGGLKGIEDIHRITINNATEKKNNVVE